MSDNNMPALLFDEESRQRRIRRQRSINFVILLVAIAMVVFPLIAGALLQSSVLLRKSRRDLFAETSRKLELQEKLIVANNNYRELEAQLNIDQDRLRQLSGISATLEEQARSYLKVTVDEARLFTGSIHSLHVESSKLQNSLPDPGNLAKQLQLEPRLRATLKEELEARKTAEKRIGLVESERDELKVSLDKLTSQLLQVKELNPDLLTIVVLYYSSDFDSRIIAEELVRLFAEVNFESGREQQALGRMILVQFNGGLRFNSILDPTGNADSFDASNSLRSFFTTTATGSFDVELGKGEKQSEALGTLLQLMQGRAKELQLTLIVPESVAPLELSSDLSKFIARVNVCVIDREQKKSADELKTTWKQTPKLGKQLAIPTKKVQSEGLTIHVVGCVRSFVRETMTHASSLEPME